MYRIDFYKDKNGVSEVQDFIDELRRKRSTNKDARIQYEQVIHYIELLMDNGTNQSTKITKQIDGDIWELRPGHNRVLYFCYLDDMFVMLHHFRKKTDKTPKREIVRAKAERDDYVRRHKES
ncbi:MAG: type II toxin-antitoxin system RelE/ParE family toxin [Synergistaceae bacterium]|nr:type II toxin-antitoxin system RelE/ParE family toxin [Synergistaceae bacterium]